VWSTRCDVHSRPRDICNRGDVRHIVFQSFNRYLGVAVGEHLGYGLTGTWTTLIGIALTQTTAV